MKPLSSFEMDIQKYNDLADEVNAEDVSTNMLFLRIDCGPLKQSLLGHCEAWVEKFTGRGLHSSTFQLNLSRFQHEIYPRYLQYPLPPANPPSTTPNVPPIPHKALTLSRKVDECKPLSTGLLNATASAELNDLYKYFKSHSASLAEPPKNLEQLAGAYIRPLFGSM